MIARAREPPPFARRFGARACALAAMSAIVVTAATAAPQTSEPGAAEQKSPVEEERRTALFNEGRAAAIAKRWNDAVDRFRQVVAIRSAPKALIALGVALEQSGHYVEAKATYAKAFSDASAAGLADDVEAAKQDLAAIALKMPAITVRLPATAPGATVVLDAARVTVGVAVEVDPGEHVVTVTPASGASWKRRVTVADGERRVVDADVTSPPEPPPPGAPLASMPSRNLAPPISAVVLGGVGVAAMAVGFGLWSDGKGKESSVASQCPNGGTMECPASLEPVAKNAHDTIVAGNVAFASGLALAAIGGVVWAVTVATRGPAKLAIGPRGAVLMGKF